MRQQNLKSELALLSLSVAHSAAAMRPPVCTAGGTLTLLLSLSVLGHDATSRDGFEFIELESEIITSKLGAIISFDTNLPENSFNISLIRPNGETVYYTQYFENALQRKTDDIMMHKYETSNDGNSTGHISENDIESYKNIDTSDECYYNFHMHLDNRNRGKLCSEKICDESFISKKIRIGPLRPEHHGNWVLSVYFYENGRQIEAFRVITVEIIETINIVPEKSIHRIGDTYKLSLAVSIPYLESCELISPKTTRDRYYERDMNSFDKCGYVIRNVTSKDQGVWKIVAVGQIVYVGKGYLYIIDNIL